MSEAERPAPRFRGDSDYARLVPVHVVWELTLACNLRCSHCGSRAGKRRPNELTTAEAIDVVDGLERLGTRELSIIGGEAYLRRDWTEIVARAADHGIYVALQTGGRALTPNRLRAGAAAGLRGLGVSIDGLREHHDAVRGVAGSFDQALLTLSRARELGLATSVNTQIGPDTIVELPALLDHIVEAGATSWQLQLTVAMGNAADNPELLLQPYQLLELMPLLAHLYRRGRDSGLTMAVGNNVGYFGPYEHLWREGGGVRGHWSGCSAGQTSIGIESDGTVKGCPSLATGPYAGGNVRDLTVEEIWSRSATTGVLRPRVEPWGFCGTCYYRDVCRGGCTWTAQSLMGAPGNNPYCHHRALTLAERGRRERVVKLEDAPDRPFATGRFAVVEEPLDPASDGADPIVIEAPHALRLVTTRAAREDHGSGRIPPELRLCHGCDRFVFLTETACPFCGGDVNELERTAQREHRRRRDLIAAARAELDALRANSP